MAKERTQKQIDHNRAFGIRGKTERRAEVPAEDAAWFEAYVKEHPTMAARVPDLVPKPKAPQDEAVKPEIKPEVKPESVPEAKVIPPPVPPMKRLAIPKAPRAEAPPKIDPDGPPRGAKNANTSGAWQDKYKTQRAEGGAMGPREYVCLEIAQVWFSFLKTAEDLLVSIGKTPVIPPDQVRGALVLAVDELLPANVDLSPEKMALAATGAMAAQCALNFKAIRAEVKRRSDARASESELDKIKRRQAEAEAKLAAERAAKAAAEAERERAQDVTPIRPTESIEPPEDLLDDVPDEKATHEFDPEKDAI